MSEGSSPALNVVGVNGALVGLTGPHSSSWLETLQTCSSIGRLVVCDRQLSEVEVSGRIDASYDSVERMLESEQLGFALLSLRNDEAPGVARLFLERKIPIIVEKPAARTAAEIAELNRLAAANGVHWATGFTNRLNPAAGELQRIVRVGALGTVVSIEGRMVTSSVQQRNPDHWLFSKVAAGGGILHWLAIHTIDLIRYITGLEYADLSAQVATRSETGIDVEDVAAVSFTMDNGAIGSLHAGYVLRGRYGDIGLTVRGSLGDAVWPMHDFRGRCDTLQVYSDAPGWETVGSKEITLPQREGPGYGGAVGEKFVDDFIAAGAGGPAFATDGDDALKAMQFVEAAYTASETGQRVRLAGM